MIKPLTYDEVMDQRKSSIPDFIIEAVNECLRKKLHGKFASFTQDEVMKEALKNFPSDLNVSVKREDHIFDNHWLDFEPLFREAGWKVEFDKPAYNESYPARFTFTKA